MSVYISVDLQKRIRNHFANCCAYCKTAESLTVSTFEFEHIIPRSAGGETIFENMCLACPSCNRYKASRQTALDPITHQEVSLFHPQQQLWADHFTWSKDSTEIIGLTPVSRATISALKMNRPQLTRIRKMWVKLREHPPKI
ncbi:HNH endonuclease [Aetokthonos hydrillicola Thurmond2011]|uniref:HNH endonuclease n=1 Tax=Aetokthonos hydrillicola Thurmond2011 TaxID=2712845 RepID=A0AAP5I6Z5_9CYAN|nr:HNH endonuclease signature motif containing protein [Aetokthonos hydrillicola]MBO3458768.1 HNH endonuclease [Aetokthonos hydrillicola CCALA 1050]MBW4585515.1 HNH endonuclease [Aetokthonos hydrillicola CCALA 1050]MDR9896137.1 HNH endonuclease [Aetokthonos hydrillicola Thurmond2011]